MKYIVDEGEGSKLESLSIPFLFPSKIGRTLLKKNAHTDSIVFLPYLNMVRKMKMRKLTENCRILTKHRGYMFFLNPRRSVCLDFMQSFRVIDFSVADIPIFFLPFCFFLSYMLKISLRDLASINFVTCLKYGVLCFKWLKV